MSDGTSDFFPAYLAARRERVERALERSLPAPSGPARTVAAAMRHAVISGGKRVRPVLAIAAYEACGGTGEAIDEPAAAIELIHTYSLVHDDLPAMDDDDLRRGRPTVHRAFGEAAAILAGDSLLTLAFELLARWPKGTGAIAERRARTVEWIAARAGFAGMVGGQIADLEAEGGSPSADELTWIHRNKTGALFAAAAATGAIHAGREDAACHAFASYGEALGIAFQIADDVLDCTGTTQDLGKTAGKDERAGKLTVAGLAGIEGARELARTWVARAHDALRPLGLLTEPLERLAVAAVERVR